MCLRIVSFNVGILVGFSIKSSTLVEGRTIDASFVCISNELISRKQNGGAEHQFVGNN